MPSRYRAVPCSCNFRLLNLKLGSRTASRRDAVRKKRIRSKRSHTHEQGPAQSQTYGTLRLVCLEDLVACSRQQAAAAAAQQRQGHGRTSTHTIKLCCIPVCDSHERASVVKRALSNGAPSAPRPFSPDRATAPSGISRRGQAIMIRRSSKRRDSIY